ncbi:hypothetical protein ACQZ61_17710 [Agrobacterium vitis]|uniref:hypothetical protein n=1 Tax=Agrobacterium vitis TaxID=373 RepID=UPI0015D98423|nr:hypothetical protein [Agrobacterium vitis]MCF1451971.1 hypothetical protein [Agrobacterium vitis]BCH53001.1 hypothetical protein RvVAR031_06110 [Agrobacterium vitis]
MKKITVSVLVVMLTGCGTMRVPVAVVSQNGDVMTGTSTASLSGGVFEVEGALDGKFLICSGNYNALDNSPTINIPTKCSDGRTGLVVAHRLPNGVDGAGTVALKDGTKAKFVFGKPALQFVHNANSIKNENKVEQRTVVDSVPFVSEKILNDSYKKTLKCTRIAALAYASQAESAESIAEAAADGCSRQIDEAADLTRANMINKAGSSVSVQTAHQITRDVIVKGTKTFVMKVRSNAAGQGAEYYEKLAYKISVGE